ncbi:MAG: hypothetical protein PHV59_05695 [Victivallales bacterium]|nr:hypothetical protein [Victivallales bacterium]
MWLFIALIMAGAWLLTAVRLSLLKRRYGWGLLLTFSLPALVFYQMAAEINLKRFHTLMSSGNTLSTACLLVIVQEALALVLGASLLRRYYLGKKLRFRHYPALLPSVLFPAACFGGMVYIFNTYCGTVFWQAALAYIFGIIILTGAAMEILQRQAREHLINLAATVSLTQIFIAMFLPVVLSGQAPSEGLVKIDMQMVSGLALLAISIGLFTLLAYSGCWRKIAELSKRLAGSEQQGGK